MQSIFILFQYYNLGSRRTIATKMYRQVISYYSSFDNAQQGLAYIVENAHKSTYCYVIEEFSYDVIHALSAIVVCLQLQFQRDTK